MQVAPLNFSRLAMSRTDRGIAVGMTGSGKTKLAQFLLQAFENVLVFDAKGTLDWKDFRRYTSLRKLVSHANSNKQTRAIYAPNAEELRNEEFHEAFFKFVYTRKGTFCYVDEVYSVAYRDELPPHYHAILTRGRERGNGLLSSTQRPMQIPSVIMSESEFWYVFRLSMPGDRKKVQDTIGVPGDVIGSLPKHQFIYARADTEERIGPLKLNIKTE